MHEVTSAYCRFTEMNATEAGSREVNCTSDRVCTVAVYSAGAELLDSLPRALQAALPPTCACATGKLRAENSAGPRIALQLERVGPQLEGTYQCSAVRSCNPANTSSPVRVSKSIYLKVSPI